jgi:hypothetical protein
MKSSKKSKSGTMGYNSESPSKKGTTKTQVTGVPYITQHKEPSTQEKLQRGMKR